MTYEEALEYIGRVCWQGSRPGLERICELCHRMGDPQNGLEFIHIAGTNGKGSTSAMISAILTQNKKKVGLFTSPFIYKFNERIAINGKPISDTDLANTLERIIPYAEAMEDKPTEFELITAVGFLYFYTQKCDVVVLECGMGGRLDSTNIINNPLISVITNIALDHTAFLGETTAEIAKEKAGIIKENSRCIVGEVDDDARASIIEKAKEMNAEIIFADLERAENITLALNGAGFDIKGLGRVNISLPGTYQLKNAQLAIGVAEALGIPGDIILKGIANAVWKGRFEVLLENPLVIYDGSHNPQGICECVNSVERLLGCRVAVFCAVMADKDYQKEIGYISKIADRVYCVTADNKRALSASDLAAAFSDRGISAAAYPDFASALGNALQYCRKKRLPLIAMGSLYMYHEFVNTLELLNNSKNEKQKNKLPC